MLDEYSIEESPLLFQMGDNVKVMVDLGLGCDTGVIAFGTIDPNGNFCYLVDLPNNIQRTLLEDVLEKI